MSRTVAGGMAKRGCASGELSSKGAEGNRNRDFSGLTYVVAWRLRRQGKEYSYNCAKKRDICIQVAIMIDRDSIPMMQYLHVHNHSRPSMVS